MYLKQFAPNLLIGRIFLKCRNRLSTLTVAICKVYALRTFKNDDLLVKFKAY